MKSARTKLFTGSLAIVLLLGLGYHYRVGVGLVLQKLNLGPQPCQKPITYSIANLDPRFGLTKAELLNTINRAEKVWESPINRQLFEYSVNGDLKISFVYDYRQEATDTLKKMGIVIKDDRTTFNALKYKYDSLVVSYNQEKAQLDKLTVTYAADKSAYENEVSYWNSRGGAPQDEYSKLEQKRIYLNNQVSLINQVKVSLNSLVDEINSAGLVLNKLIATLNLQISTYNTVGASAGKTFNEGEYVSNNGATAINIFQFNNTNQLLRVLAHELGHSLGLEHIDNPKAIMYYVNEGINEKLTADDLAALKRVCGISMDAN